MNRVLLLAWRYVAYHKVKTAILTIGLTLTFVLPLTATLLIRHYGDALLHRARATPLVLGVKGNRFDLVLKALYFSAAPVDDVTMADVSAIRDSGYGLPIPLHLEYTARGTHPIVGTTLDYFEFRGLHPQRGKMPMTLGEAVLGATAAEQLGLGPGDALFSDQRSLYDITRTYPLKMHIIGVLAKTDSPDDNAVFVDIKTAWIIAGITHGHQDVSATSNPAIVLQRSDDEVVTNAAIVEYNEVTPQNLHTFHTHAPEDKLPVTAVLVVPNDAKGATILKGRYSVSETRQLLVPEEVVTDLMGLVFQVKRFFDASFALVTVATLLFLILVMLLSRALRRREMETMFKIGCSRRMTFWLQLGELGIVLALSIISAGILAGAALLVAPLFLHWL